MRGKRPRAAEEVLMFMRDLRRGEHRGQVERAGPSLEPGLELGGEHCPTVEFALLRLGFVVARIDCGQAVQIGPDGVERVVDAVHFRQQLIEQSRLLLLLRAFVNATLVEDLAETVKIAQRDVERMLELRRIDARVDRVQVPVAVVWRHRHASP